MNEFWSKLRKRCVVSAVEQAELGLPFLKSHPSTAARKWLSAFLSFPPQDHSRLAYVLVLKRFEPQLPIDQDLDVESSELLTQMLGRTRHIPKRTLDALASNPTRILEIKDISTWDASHVNPVLEKASHRNLRNAVAAALRDGDLPILSKRPNEIVVSNAAGRSEVTSFVEFGGLWQVRISASVSTANGPTFRNITLPFCLGYVVDGYDDVTPDRLEAAAKFAVQELQSLQELLSEAMAR